MLLGVIIESGIQDWQIIQQKNGVGNVNLEGKWYYDKTIKFPEVFVRIQEESSGRSIIPWKKAETDMNGGWKISISDIPAGGLYRLETCLKTEETVSMEWAARGDMRHYIGVGDLYVIAGQSNSAGYGKDPVTDEPELGVHILKNDDCWGLASHPLNDSTNTKHEVNRETSNSGHSPYLSFAKTLKRQLGYPIGLIQTSLGGSSIVRWDPEEIGDLYQNMMMRIRAQESGIKGILWYQGCSDTGEKEADLYKERFQHLVQSTRQESGQYRVPFITVQLNRLLSTPESGQVDKNWGKIREFQRELTWELEDVYIIPSWDGTHMSDNIHNSSAFNLVLGERMAYMALGKIYGRTCMCEAPDIEQVTVNKDIVLLKFNNVYEAISMFDMPVNKLPFSINDQEGKVKIVTYQLKDKDTIQLHLERGIIGNARIDCGMRQNPECIIPVDIGTHYPILSFSKEIS